MPERKSFERRGAQTRMAVAALGILAWAAATQRVGAWAEASVWDGIYTRAQAQRGQALYAKACASCHKDDLGGHGTTPSLAGEDFVEKWDGQTVGDLFEKMQVSMPADHPGSLSREQNAAILAYILRSNDFPAGETELRSDGDWLAKIRFSAAKPK
jgi:S-disulfanyl-L-cysteine oxidoreductase SoxD